MQHILNIYIPLYIHLVCLVCLSVCVPIMLWWITWAQTFALCPQSIQRLYLMADCRSAICALGSSAPLRRATHLRVIALISSPAQMWLLVLITSVTPWRVQEDEERFVWSRPQLAHISVFFIFCLLAHPISQRAHDWSLATYLILFTLFCLYHVSFILSIEKELYGNSMMRYQ